MNDITLSEDLVVAAQSAHIILHNFGAIENLLQKWSKCLPRVIAG